MFEKAPTLSFPIGQVQIVQLLWLGNGNAVLSWNLNTTEC